VTLESRGIEERGEPGGGPLDTPEGRAHDSVDGSKNTFGKEVGLSREGEVENMGLRGGRGVNWGGENFKAEWPNVSKVAI
jgi:hypothetical protein